MKRRFTKPAAVLLASLLLAASAATAASAAIAGPSAPTFTTVMRHTPKILFPVPGAATLTVMDEETGLPVAGAKYDLIRKSLYGGADSKIGTYTTDKDGKITVSHATTGTFYWRAASEAEGYAADGDKHDFTVWAAQFADAAANLAKPAPEPEPEPEQEDDGYIALNAEKAAALAAFIDENGRYYEGSAANYYLLPAFYNFDEKRVMEVSLVHYADEDKLALAFGRAMVDGETDDVYTVAILTLNNKAEKYFTYTDMDGDTFHMTVDARNFFFTLDPDVIVWSADYEGLTAYNAEDGTETSEEIRDRIIYELRSLLIDFQDVMEYWGLDMTVDDIGFTMHDLSEDITFEADAE